jgi:hypothetical protein
MCELIINVCVCNVSVLCDYIYVMCAIVEKIMTSFGAGFAAV